MTANDTTGVIDQATPPKNNYLRYQWTSIWLCVGTFLGLLFVIIYAISTSLNIGLLLLWCMAYLVIGALLGFIFSVPKMISDTKSPADTSALTDAAKAKANTVALKAKYQENTNLTQISDWLTKVLIGATLVQMKEIPKFIHKMAIIMGKGIVNPDAKGVPIDSATVVSAGIILFFMTWGFISGYLVMKLVLTEQFADIGDQ